MSIGPGTVSDHATVVTSNVGVGILKAGWHCCGFPQGSGSPNHCPDCTDCTGDLCLERKLCRTCNQNPGSACDGAGSCKTGKELVPIPQVCSGLGIKEEGQTPLSCDQVPELKGQAGLCGAAIAVTYRMVTHNCDSVDLAGGELIEHITSDFGCGGNGRIAAGICVIESGNMLAPPGNRCRDYYYVCKPAGTMEDGFSCREVLTQEIFIDSCPVATKQIVFTITKDSAGCRGTAQRN